MEKQQTETPAEPARGHIWWLASFPKTGNTWLRAFLSAYVTGDLKLNALTNGLGPGDLNTYFYRVCAPRDIGELSPYEMLLLRPAALFHLATVSPPRPLMVKTHAINGHLNGVTLIPDGLTAGAIYMVRDPRDVVISYAEHMGDTIDQAIDDLANPENIIAHEDGLYHYLSDWSSHVSSWCLKYPYPVAVVRYEDLLTSPAEKFARIIRYIFKHEPDRRRLDYALESTTFSALQALEAAEGFKEKRAGGRFFRTGQAGGWRDVLTGDQVQRIETDHGAIMEKFNYERTTAGTLRNIAGR